MIGTPYGVPDSTSQHRDPLDWKCTCVLVSPGGNKFGVRNWVLTGVSSYVSVPTRLNRDNTVHEELCSEFLHQY